MFKGPSASSTPTTISSTTSNRSLNRVHCSFSFDEKKKKKTKSFDLHSYRRTYSFNRRIRAFARACIIQCNLLILTYLLYHLSPRYFRLYVTYIHTHTHTHTYIHTPVQHTYTHTHSYIQTDILNVRFLAARATSNRATKKKETREKSEKKKEKKKKKRKRETNERRVFVSHIRECSLFHLHFSPFY